MKHVFRLLSRCGDSAGEAKGDSDNERLAATITAEFKKRGYELAVTPRASSKGMVKTTVNTHISTSTHQRDVVSS